jgi:hypothetical protein
MSMTTDALSHWQAEGEGNDLIPLSGVGKMLLLSLQRDIFLHEFATGQLVAHPVGKGGLLRKQKDHSMSKVFVVDAN